MTGQLPRHTTLTRILHWLTAALVFSTLFIGFVMVNSLAPYSTLLLVHKSLGVLILAVMLVRIVNRFTHRLPPLPPTVSSRELKFVEVSELSLYGLLLAQPLIGWAMVSASGAPVVVFGSIRLPRIAPFNAELYGLLRNVHSVIAYCLVAIIAAHVSAVLLHTLTVRDRMLSRMTFPLARAAKPQEQD